jgi:hypothetical protein
MIAEPVIELPVSAADLAALRALVAPIAEADRRHGGTHTTLQALADVIEDGAGLGRAVLHFPGNLYRLLCAHVDWHKPVVPADLKARVLALRPLAGGWGGVRVAPYC